MTLLLPCVYVLISCEANAQVALLVGVLFTGLFSKNHLQVFNCFSCPYLFMVQVALLVGVLFTGLVPNVFPPAPGHCDPAAGCTGRLARGGADSLSARGAVRAYERMTGPVPPGR